MPDRAEGVEPLLSISPSRGDREREASPSNLPLEGEMPDRAEGVEPLLSISLRGRSGGQPQPISP